MPYSDHRILPPGSLSRAQVLWSYKNITLVSGILSCNKPFLACSKARVYGRALKNYHILWSHIPKIAVVSGTSNTHHIYTYTSICVHACILICIEGEA